MQIFSTITNLTNTYDNIVIALGTFDGVHRGHQSIIQQAIHLAKSIGGVCVVFTFSNHPLTILSPTNAPLRISDNRCKQADMAALGVDILMNVPFTKKMSALAPLEFLQLLRDNFAPKYVVVGPNYSFGRKGEGTPRMLLQKGAAYGFIAEIHPVVQVNHHLISSTKIRNLLLGGQLEAANTMLGKPYRISGSVIPGDQRGRLLGFPTANLAIGEHRAMLPNGVYAVRTTVDGTAYRAVANIGTNPTFNGLTRHVEVHLLNFAQDLYEKTIFVEFLKKIRDEKKFSGKDALITQIQADITAAAAIIDLQ